LCAAVALGCLKLLHQDVAELAEKVILSLRGDPDNHLLAGLLRRLSLIEDPQLAKLSAASFVFSGFFALEGTGLYFEKKWAEYLTLVATAAFVPFELYALFNRFAVLKLLTLLVNLAVIVFLAIAVRTSMETRKQ
jgi:uncharacterized membrane protein (DUF2068 family)